MNECTISLNDLAVVTIPLEWDPLDFKPIMLCPNFSLWEESLSYSRSFGVSPAGEFPVLIFQQYQSFRIHFKALNFISRCHFYILLNVLAPSSVSHHASWTVYTLAVFGISWFPALLPQGCIDQGEGGRRSAQLIRWCYSELHDYWCFSYLSSRRHGASYQVVKWTVWLLFICRRIK